jgi:tRNA threonylcarbamoyladenosine biosynthesis protein TsaB
MACILSIETATAVCSVALSKDGAIAGIKESFEPNAHSSILTSLIRDLMAESGLPLSFLDAVAVSRGLSLIHISEPTRPY